MFKILATFGNDHLVGTHKGNIGVISQCIMEDEGLWESMELRLAHTSTDAPFWRAIALPPQPIHPAWGPPPDRAIEFEEELVQPIAWRYGDDIIRVGYSHLTKTWVVWDYKGRRRLTDG